MMDPETTLRELGFGEYEARAYVALLRKNPLNGYELAKASKLPRANVYSVLAKLEERDAVVRLDTPAGTRYAPVPPEELLKRLGQRYQASLATAEDSLGKIAAFSEYVPVLNTRGYGALLENARSLIDAAERRLLVAIWPNESRNLAGELSRAEERGVKLTTLCLANCADECGNCRGRVFRYGVAPEQANRWLLVMPDGAEALAGEIGNEEETLGVRTRQRLLLDLAGSYIRNSIALAAMLQDIGSRISEVLSPETNAILAALGPGESDEGWLEHVRRLLRRSPTKWQKGEA